MNEFTNDTRILIEMTLINDVLDDLRARRLLHLRDSAYNQEVGANISLDKALESRLTVRSTRGPWSKQMEILQIHLTPPPCLC